MSAFRTCQAIEQESLFRLHPWLQYRTDGHYVITHKGPLAKLLQEQVGDVLLNSENGTLWSIECKAEERNAKSNFFLESWSNKSRFNPGWFWKIEADFLLYHFLNDGTDDKDECYVMRLAELREWAFKTVPGIDGAPDVWRMCRWSERRQSNHNQLNDTWGFCVPITEVLAGVKSAKRIYLDGCKATNSAPFESARGNGDFGIAQR